MTLYVCPECAAGKHLNCNGQAWDREKDEPTNCACGHSMGEVTEQVIERDTGFRPIRGTSYYGNTEPGVESLDENDVEAIENLLMGRKVTKVDESHLHLDNGTVLKMVGHEGGCICGAGDYSVTELNGTDNVITKVEFDYHPDGDDRPYGQKPDAAYCEHKPQEDEYGGHYRIWVYAEHKINLMEVTGTDGNGYYGTGYGILVRRVS